VTPLFPREAKTFCMNLKPGPRGLIESQAAQFVHMASSRFNGRSGTHFVVDTERITLPRSVPRRNIEHVRGLGLDVWASSAKRCGMAES
jgi:hypothetical protein